MAKTRKHFTVIIPFNEYRYGRYNFLTNIEYSGVATFDSSADEDDRFDYDVDHILCEGKQIPMEFVRAMDIEPKETPRIDEAIIAHLEYLFADEVDLRRIEEADAA